MDIATANCESDRFTSTRPAPKRRPFSCATSTAAPSRTKTGCKGKPRWLIDSSRPNTDLTAQHRCGRHRVSSEALGPWGLTALGIGAVIGGGIFVITGVAAAEHAGPAIVLSFIFAAICCRFCALSYAEFAALMPMSGSAYSYAYATLGEGVAWFIGWKMVLEYGVSASAVAVSWTGYFMSLLEHFGIHLPAALTNAPLASPQSSGHTGALVNLPGRRNCACADLALLRRHPRIQRRKPDHGNPQGGLDRDRHRRRMALRRTWNWHPFIPENRGPSKYGWSGILRGASMVFFAYIGFEATSIAAQEANNPQRDMPIGILASLAICTVLYIGMALVMTGLLPFNLLGTNEPVVTAVQGTAELGWLRWHRRDWRDDRLGFGGPGDDHRASRASS